MKRILLALVVVSAGVALACGRGRAPEKFRQKLVILGFDGMDPKLVQKWMDEGKLPNMKKLAAAGSGVRPLGTTHSPESPTAWASFATGVNAGKHNIYDFLIRDTSTYLPDLGMVHFEPPHFILNYIPISKPVIQSIRGGTSFWVTAGRAGVRTSELTVPVTFPPEEVPNGEMLSGLPLPDIRRTMGTFYYFGTDLSRYEEGNTEFGGILKRLVFDGDTAQSELVGPPNPVVKQQIRDLRAKYPQAVTSETDKMKLAELEAREDVRLPMTIHWNKPGKSATIEIGDQSIHLGEHEWSKWINLDFSINLLLRVHGMAQFYLIGAGPELQLYVSPVNFKPDAPPTPMSYPERFSADLFERLGPYRTLGWAEATWPLNEDRIDEKVFMDDLYRAFDDRAQVILQRLDSKQWDLLVGVIESTDRVQHMMWRLIDPQHPMYDKKLAAQFGDAIERVYRKCDDFVGEVMARVDPSTPIVIVSDHGFHSFRQSVNLNTWLVQEGFMAIQGQQPGEKKLKDLFGGGTFWENVDWAHTKAYAMGLGQVYLNLKGREGRGIVSPGTDAKQVTDDLAARLMTMTDPNTHAKMVDAVYKRDDVYNGPFTVNASEIQVGLADGYRVSWQSTLGGSPPGIVYPNMKKWSGDHGSFDYKQTSGVLISSRKLEATAANIMDIAPTVLKYFGLPIPSDIDGKPLF
ncbi:MAG TPA: alkaline phosphatase family protein [Vicinamibacterales bacterium]|nr:alkaline phosphatase family protein [Vicinamibacterales bacterium]